MNIKYWQIIIFVLGMIGHVQTQNIYAKLRGGAMYYQGDLTPQSINLSFGPANPAWGATVGYSLNSWKSLEVGYLKGRLSADDKYADIIGRRQRNLSFVSPVNEWAIQTSLNINHFLPSLDKYNIRFFIQYGINYFTFDPQTNYKGKWIRLQPLGTEGQFLEGANKQPYKLYSFSKILGVAIEFNISDKLLLCMEIAPRKTFTDYLDDVSDTYPGYEALINAGNNMGAKLSNRIGEYQGTGPINLPQGAQRGNSDKNDWYTFIGVSLKFDIYNFKKVIPRNLPDDSLSREEYYTKFIL